MMDGRVKTLHPALHGGILARRDRPDDLASLEQHGLGLVDVVVVNLYPFVKAASNPATPFDALVEEIDIGGPSLVRAAAKNFRGVLVVVDPADYRRLLAALDEGPTLAFRFELMRKAIAHTAAYDTAIAGTLGQITLDGERFERPTGGPSTLGSTLSLSMDKIRDLRYGENPHQKAAWYAPGRAATGLGAAHDPPGQGAVVHQPARPRRGRADRARVRRTGGSRHQAHQSVRRRDRQRRPRMRTCARAKPTALPRSAASSR